MKTDKGGTNCVSKLSYLTSCTTSYQCQDYLDLYCLSSKCNCLSSAYWVNFYYLRS
jgi:hypothetical protein